jgi:YVTN family beta-propeller protein
MGSHTPLSAGEDIAAYRIEALVGRGGMGEVYRAVDLRLGRPVALKLLAPEIADDERSRERFMRESRIAASLDHPNVLPIYEAGESDGRVFIAQRFVEGTDLRRMLRAAAPIDPQRALALLAPVAGALDAAHSRGLIHRDVKPANVLIAGGQEPERDEHVYLSDFGLATFAEDAGAGELFSGTAEYAAPELVTGGPIDARSDVYSLGCVLFECLAGEPPYRGDSVMGVLWGHVNDPVPPATERNRALPQAIDGVLQKALAKDRARRPASCRALLASARAAFGLEARRRLLARIVAGVAAVIAAAVLAALLTVRGEDAPAGAGAGAIVRIDPATNAVSRSMAVEGGPTAVAAADAHIWATDAGGAAVARLDAARGTVRTSSAHGVPSDVAIGGARAVVANGADGTVAVFDTASGAFQGTIQLGGFGYATASVAAAGRWAWVAAGRDLKRVDLLTLVPAGSRRIAVARDDELHGDLFLSDVAVGAGWVWVTGDVLNPMLWRVDPVGERRPLAIALPFGPDAVTLAAGDVWVANQLDDSVTRVDARTGAVGPTIEVGREPVAVAAGAGALWVANRLDGTVMRVDPARNRVTATIAVGERAEDVVAGVGAVWALTGSS